MGLKGPPFRFFSAQCDFFSRFFNILKGSPLRVFCYFATECVFINQKGPPFTFFGTVRPFPKEFFFENFKFFPKKMFCAFWALDIAPTWDVPVLFIRTETEPSMKFPGLLTPSESFTFFPKNSHVSKSVTTVLVDVFQQQMPDSYSEFFAELHFPHWNLHFWGFCQKPMWRSFGPQILEHVPNFQTCKANFSKLRIDTDTKFLLIVSQDPRLHLRRKQFSKQNRLHGFFCKELFK